MLNLNSIMHQINLPAAVQQQKQPCVSSHGILMIKHNSAPWDLSCLMTHPLAPSFPPCLCCTLVCECVIWPSTELKDDQLGIWGGKSGVFFVGEKTEGNILSFVWINKSWCVIGYQQRLCCNVWITAFYQSWCIYCLYLENSCLSNMVWLKYVPMICLLNVHLRVCVISCACICVSFSNRMLSVLSVSESTLISGWKCSENPQQSSCLVDPRQNEAKEKEKT